MPVLVHAYETASKYAKKWLEKEPVDAETFFGEDLYQDLVDTAVMDHFFHTGCESKYSNVYYQLIQSMVQVAIGLELWIHRSIVNPKK